MFPPLRIKPATGQESVWDYPRPPRVERVSERLRVIFNGKTVADTVRGFRVLETSHPPVYYLPPGDVAQAFLHTVAGCTWCEFKGQARYWSLEVNGKLAERTAWSYPDPSRAYSEIAGYFAFYASRIDECWVGDERVQPQQAIFTEAGSPRESWDPSKVVRQRGGGSGCRRLTAVTSYRSVKPLRWQ